MGRLSVEFNFIKIIQYHDLNLDSRPRTLNSASCQFASAFHAKVTEAVKPLWLTSLITQDLTARLPEVVLHAYLKCVWCLCNTIKLPNRRIPQLIYMKHLATVTGSAHDEPQHTRDGHGYVNHGNSASVHRVASIHCMRTLF
jgi:hypothetical protein